MKKLFLGLFMIICLVGVIGCQPSIDGPGGEVPGGDNPVSGEQKYKDEVTAYLNELIPDTVSESIDLEGYYEFEDGSLASFEWKSSNGRTITSKGKYKQNLFDEEVTLTAQIVIETFDGNTYSADYSKTVKTNGSESLEEYKKIIEGYLPDYVYSDFELVYREGTFRNKNIFGDITYESTMPDVITSDGKYINKMSTDQNVEFKYTVVINGITFTGSKVIVAEAYKFEYYTGEAIDYLADYFKGMELVYSKVDLPETDDKGRVNIIWYSSDHKILSDDGYLQTFDPGKEVTMTAEIECYDGSVTWEKKFRTYNEEEALEFIVNRMHRDEIQQYLLKAFAYTKQNNGYLPFYTRDTALSSFVISTTEDNKQINYLEGESNSSVEKMNIITGLKPWDSNGRPTTKKTSTDYITIHDTGSTESAAWWNDYVSSGRDTRETSWHFTVGDTEIYQHVPLEEVAWHAGDGSARFGLNDTGVKYTTAKPIITVGEDHYLYINGQKSKIAVPYRTYTENGIEKLRYPEQISDAGLYTCLGENGNYYMGNVYASAYWGSSNLRVCTGGGNRNSVGFETCINFSSDYNQVMRNTANIVAKLLIYYGLHTDRVLTHRHFSDKLCPQVMIQNELLNNFQNMIENEYIIAKYFEGITFKYESSNPELLANDGNILKQVEVDTRVSYKVTVSYKGTTKTFEKSVLIKANK